MALPAIISVTLVRRLTLAVIIVAGCGVTLRAGRNDAVAISATAVADYVRPLAADGKLVPQTYVFNEGQYLSAPTVDGSLERMTFADLTRTLAVNLAAQEYYPTKDVPSADLLIRVFWGATTTYEDPQREQNIEAINSAMAGFQQLEQGAFVDLSALQNTLALTKGAQSGVEGAIARNAALLGYRRELDRLSHKLNLDPEEIMLRTELNEERYFVVLLAYDYQLMRREKKARLLWITRLSIRGPGNNFTEALPALAQAGAQVYGRNLDGLERIKIRDLPRGEVTLGELKVIGVAEPPLETPKQK
jgi:hypothetical protein